MTLPVEISRLDLDASKPLRRTSPRAPEHRQPGYDEQFDWRTVLYDCFVAPDGDRLVCLGPPLRGLAPVVVPAIERALRPSLFGRRDVRDLDRHVQIWLRSSARAGAFDGGLFEQQTIAVQPNRCGLFQGRHVLLTMSRDNELVWIRDWVLFHAVSHGCDAVLLYDNASSRYDLANIHETISSVPGIAVAVVVPWPFTYGPQGPIWDSNFAQPGALEHARHRFLARAATVINADIDELVVTRHPQSVCDLARDSRTGLLQYPGVWIENVSDAPIGGARRHRHFAHRMREPRRTAPKWTVVPARCGTGAQWRVHGVAGMEPDEKASDAVAYRHFWPITTGWKSSQKLLPPDPPGANHERDDELLAAMRCFNGEDRREV